MSAARALITIAILSFLLGPNPALALDLSLDLSQYAHRHGNGGTDSQWALFKQWPKRRWVSLAGQRIRIVSFRWRSRAPLAAPRAGQGLHSAPYSLLITRDGTLWTGTFAGLLSWDGSKLTEYSEVGQVFVTSLLEDREGTVWAGILFDSRSTRKARLCAIRSATCSGTWMMGRLAHLCGVWVG
jgi:hypothetical protein